MPERVSAYAHAKGHKIVNGAAIVSVIFVIVTLALVGVAWDTKRATLLYPIIDLWAVGPPFWFWLEYYFIYERYGDDAQFDRLKYGQDVSKAIWAGTLTALIALVASDHFKPAPSSSPVFITAGDTH